MRGYYTKTIWRGILAISLSLCLLGCENLTSDLMEIDENGKEHNNSEINIRNSLVSAGVKGYAIDSLYTEFGFSEGKYTRILSLKKATAYYQNNGQIKDIKWNNEHPNIRYSEKTIYEYAGGRSEIEFNNNMFAELVENYKGGKLESIVRYRYQKSGYLNYVILERPGEQPMNIYFKYPKADGSGGNGDCPTVEGGIIIEEAGRQYKINLAMQKLENKHYVCNVLRYGNAPLTNKYVINPDLYYMGIYGVPIKYLPDEIVANGVVTDLEGGKVSVINQVGNWKFFYK